MRHEIAHEPLWAPFYKCFICKVSQLPLESYTVVSSSNPFMKLFTLFVCFNQCHLRHETWWSLVTNSPSRGIKLKNGGKMSYVEQLETHLWSIYWKYQYRVDIVLWWTCGYLFWFIWDHGGSVHLYCGHEWVKGVSSWAHLVWYMNQKCLSCASCNSSYPCGHILFAFRFLMAEFCFWASLSSPPFQPSFIILSVCCVHVCSTPSATPDY